MDARGIARKAFVPIVLFLVVFGVFAGTSEKKAMNTDGYAASAGAWRIATTGSPFLDGLDVTQLRGTHDDDVLGGMSLSESPNGHVNAQVSAGPILVAVPAYWMLTSSEDTAPDDFSLVPAALTASALTALTVLLMFFALTALVPRRFALVVALVFAFTTPTWSVTANGMWSHVLTQVAIAGAALASSRERWWLAGTALGFGMLGRPHLALIAAVVGLGMGLTKRDWRIPAGVALPTLASLGLLVLWSSLVHGQVSIGGAYGNSKAVAVVTNAFGSLETHLGFLVAPDRGLFIWTPLLLLLLPALFRIRSLLPAWTLWLAAGGVLYTLVQLRIGGFQGGSGFYGYRHGLELLTSLAPALTMAAFRLGPAARVVAGGLVGLQFAAISLGASFESFFVSRYDVWQDNSLWMVLRHFPLLIGTWLLLGVAIGVLATLRFAPSAEGIGEAERQIGEGHGRTNQPVATGLVFDHADGSRHGVRARSSSTDSTST